MRLAFFLLLYCAYAAAALALLVWLLSRAFPRAGRKVFVPAAAVTGVLHLLPPAGALTPDGPLCWFFQKWGNILIGYFLYFFGTLFLVWLVLLFVRLVRRRGRESGRRPGQTAARVVLAVLIVLTLAVNVCGSRTAQDVKVTHWEVPAETLGQKEPLRIVLIADLHIGVNSSPKLYEDMVGRINEQNADLVLVAGDIVTSSFNAMREPETYAAILRGIRSRLGTYAVYGNHDVDEPLLGGFTVMGPERAVRNPAFPAFFEACGWTLLTDETAVIPELSGLVIAGRRDKMRPGDGVAVRASLEELLAGVDPAAPVLLLDHEPKGLDELSRYGVDMALSGHTHDGQMFPGNLIVRAFNQQTCGQKDWGGTQVFVTSGIGYYGPPLRLGTISEVMVIDLR